MWSYWPPAVYNSYLDLISTDLKNAHKMRIFVGIWSAWGMKLLSWIKNVLWVKNVQMEELPMVDSWINERKMNDNIKLLKINWKKTVWQVIIGTEIILLI